MANSQIEWMVLGMVSTNTYLVKNQDTGELLIIDPADAAGRIQEKIGQMEGRPAAILLTHGHFDHMLAADALRSAYDIPVYACIQEKDLLKNARYNLSASWASPHVMEADRYLADGETFREAGFEIRLLHTPGHTEGSCCYYLPEEAVLFSGDTLFAGSVGRTDFPTSSGADMRKSLQRLLSELPADTRVCPGHGEETTIAYEKRYNPFA
ncbi:MAG TPA: MBL fold metallo-hydrolase [Candidatus Pullilachnospira stercoravium]|uniref:MBL fold metallo-hydrolase n=1 Tax=Candidatus Pullilachnospira stercoravium TaxID=2840913 RepID=A0A9D1NXB4_9FIRM|nr:MBL fold metallo-hydrolase [Candidatus Pullilachnospira stercoravium]